MSKLRSTAHHLKAKGLSLSSAAIIAASVLSGGSSENKNLKEKDAIHKETASKRGLLYKINHILKNKKDLTSYEELELERLLSQYSGLDLKITLENNRLNNIYGYIGAEQHLYRWPGDSLMQHNLIHTGMAPQRGAFGYFDNAEQEKYYIAAQLHLLPDWNQKWQTLKPWYRYRKVFVYNPDNGKAVIASIGDAGPAGFTGKSFGGSPEVMNYLEKVDGSKKSKVVVLFLNEDNKSVNLGAFDPDAKLASKPNSQSQEP